MTPLREQREGDTAVPTDTTGSTQPGGGALPPGQTAPQTQPTPAPVAAARPQPSPTPTAPPEPHAGPTVTPTPTPAPIPPRIRSRRRADADAAPVVSGSGAPTGDVGVGRSRMIRPSSSDGAEREHLGHERPDLARREVDHRDDEPALELLARVVGDLRRRALDADLRPEVDRQLPGRLARLGEVVDRGHAADAHVDRQELVEVDLGHAACSRPMTFIRRSSAFIANARVSATDTPNSVCSSSSPSIHGGFRTPSATGPTSTSVRWIASM